MNEVISTKVMNIAHFLTQSAMRIPEHLAIVYGDKKLTWNDVNNKVNSLSYGLAQKGVKKGTKVLVHTKNNVEIILAQLAIFKLGAVWVPTNFRITPDEATYLFESSNSEYLIIQSEFEEHFKKISKVNSLKYTLTIGEANWGNENIADFVSKYEGRVYQDSSVDYHDPCWFFFTSGTTGYPKAAVLTHGQMTFVITNHLCDLMPKTDYLTDRSIVLAPLSHGAGIHFLAQLARGVTSIIPSSTSFDVDEVWNLIEEYQVTNMFTVPTIINSLVNNIDISTYDKSSLRYIIYAGAPMYVSDQQNAIKKLGLVLVQYYGLGEVTGNITVLPTHLHSSPKIIENGISSCGYARTGIQISIQNDSGIELPNEVSGEICVCGPAVFSGYYNNVEANMKSFRNGWFRTGDIGYLNSEGFLFITGRMSDMYISGGSNIYPRELEEKILLHPNVKEVAVFGIPDKTWGEVGVAVIVEKEITENSQNNIKIWINDHIAGYKKPKIIDFIGELPKTGYGKVDKKLLKKRYES